MMMVLLLMLIFHHGSAKHLDVMLVCVAYMVINTINSSLNYPPAFVVLLNPFSCLVRSMLD